MTDALVEKIKKIKILAMDVDGVLTSGDINLDEKGSEIKKFNVHDGFGIVTIKKFGFHTVIISARHSDAVTARASDLKIEKVYQNAYPKINAYEDMLCYFSAKDEDVCFIGDDLPDLQVLKRAGFAVTVANATSEVKEAADFITTKSGGQGAVRELIELLLKTQNKWDDVVSAMVIK